MICKRYLIGSRYSLEYLYTLEDMFKSKGTIDDVPSLSVYDTLWTNFDKTYWDTANGIGFNLWSHIWALYSDHIAFITDEEWDADISKTFRFWKNFYLIWKSTHVYYEKMIALLEANETKLMAQVSTTSESTNHFNDTPEQSGDYSGLDYATTISKNSLTTKSDAGTILERLEEVRRRYTDYYEKWAREFNKLFISPLNYESSITLEETY